MSKQQVHHRHTTNQHFPRIGQIFTLKNVVQVVNYHRPTYQGEINKFYRLCRDKLIDNLLTELGDDILDKLFKVGIIEELFEEFNGSDFEEFKKQIVQKLIEKDPEGFKRKELKELENQDLEQVKQERIKEIENQDSKEFKNKLIQRINDTEPEQVRDEFFKEFDEKYEIEDFEDLINVSSLKFVGIANQVLDTTEQNSKKFTLSKLFSNRFLKKIIGVVVGGENEQFLIKLLDLIKSESYLIFNLYKVIRMYVYRVEHELNQEFKNLKSFLNLLMTYQSNRVNQVKHKEIVNVYLIMFNHFELISKQLKPFFDLLEGCLNKVGKVLTEEDIKYLRKNQLSKIEYNLR